MTLARKGSRRIIVDGVTFRWTVRRKPTYHQANGWSPLTFVVEHAVAPASLLVVSLPCAHPGNWLGQPSQAVTPGMVTESIRRAVADGWKPAQRGRPFALTLADRATHPR
jgi:hypothetical protein